MRHGSRGGGHAAASRPRGDGFVADLEYNPDLIQQTRALKEYGLNPNYMKSLKVTRTTNPRDPSYAPMKLYNIWDLKVRPCGTLRDANSFGEGPVAARGQLRRARCRHAACDAARLRHCTLLARCAQLGERVAFRRRGTLCRALWKP